MFVTFCLLIIIFFSFTFYFLIQSLASLGVNFSSVVVSEIFRNPDHIIYRLATELNKPKIYMYISKPWARLGRFLISGFIEV